MSQEPLGDFLTPMTPTERDFEWPSAVTDQQQQSKPPDSPSKLLARNRLGNLLCQIRTGDTTAIGREGSGGVEGVPGRMVVVAGSDQHQREQDDVDIESGEFVGGRHGARQHRQLGKRLRREKRVVFELRGKPFGLRDVGHSETVYALCRKWMYGKDDEPTIMEQQQQDEEEAAAQRQIMEEGTGAGGERSIAGFGGALGSGHRSLDLLATKDIYALPPPRPDAPPLLDPRPQRLIRRVDRRSASQASADGVHDSLLDDHLRHWKKVKQNWYEYGKKREQRYVDSLQLLRTVYGIAQQTQQI